MRSWPEEPIKKNAIAIFLTTPGGEATAAEKLVEVARHHYDLVYFVVPVAAMSAGTIFCMAGDKIYMDYSSSLGPIDPQVPDREGRFLVPALGHLDKVNDIIIKSANNSITPVEFEWLMRQDLAMLRFYEQARDLSVALLEKWLVQFKFKDWKTHRTHNPGNAVTDEEKQARASEIAKLLSNNAHWHSHGRMISMRTLTDECRLEIDDFGKDPALQLAVRRYIDTLSEYLGRSQIKAFIYSGLVASESDMTTSSTLEDMMKSDVSRQLFSAQREKVREQAERSKVFGAPSSPAGESQGVDRSSQLIPIVRPTFVRALSKA